MSVWLLPENISDMLPREARAIETLRQDFLNLVVSHGFELIRPPAIEYIDSLQVGTGADLDLRTFKIVDQISGRLIGFRADMTPQVARIDAHILNRKGVTRLCYAGSVLHARPLHPMASREPYVAGVEVFGSRSKESDLEVIQLGIETLRRFNTKSINMDFGNVGVLKAVLAGKIIAPETMRKLLYALSHKDISLILELADELGKQTVNDLRLIASTFGGEEVLAVLKEKLSSYSDAIKAIDETLWLAQRSGADSYSFDFADVHGYGYLTGVTFGVTVPKRFQAILRGGRYDDIGAQFGRNRPAVGFTVYLREIANLMEIHRPKAILAPCEPENTELQKIIEELRKNGHIVVVRLPEDEIESLRQAYHLDQELVLSDGAWTLQPRPSAV